MLAKQEKRIKRHARVRAKVIGSIEKPRLCVFRSNSHIYAQLIDDTKKSTIVSANDIEIKEKTDKVNVSKQVGALLAKKAAEKKIIEVVFDRGGYKYHGRVKALAEGAREGGLKF
jgi:large subunit ribosomal protein L18